MRIWLAAALIALGCSAAAAQQGGAPAAGQPSPSAGQANQGPAASDLQRSNPPGMSDASGDVSGSQTNRNSGSAPVPVQRGATENGQPRGEITRSDSAR